MLTKNPLYLALADTHPVVKFTVERMLERRDSKVQPLKPGDGGQPGGKQTTKDFLTRCYEAQAKYPDLVTDRIIRMYNIDNVLAGSDTTSISLRAVSSFSAYSCRRHRLRVLGDLLPHENSQCASPLPRRDRLSGSISRFRYLERVK